MDHSQHQSYAQSAGDWFSTLDFMPHGHCYLWKPSLVWIHAGSDTLIGLAYVSISLSLYVLVRKIKLPFSWVFLAFGAFIGFCGLTHFMEVWTLWDPQYWISGFVKIVTAIASVLTAFLLFPLMPKVLAFAHTAQLSEDRRIKLEESNMELTSLYRKLKEMDNLKTDFFSNVSHELRTPLTLILNPLEDLKNSSKLNEKERERLDMALRNSRILLKQVNTLLDISKLDARKLEPQYVEFDLAKLTRTTASNFESSLAARRIALEIKIPNKLLIQADPDHIQRVIMNLLSNAVKFSHEGGKVLCSLEQVGGEAVLRVQNKGEQIKPEDRTRIFERFHQSDSGSTRKTGGTGLGLAIVKELVNIHKGSVEVEEREDLTCFKVTLPLLASKGVVVQAHFEPDIDTSSSKGILDELTSKPEYKENERVLQVDKPHVLLVEDNYELNHYAREILSPDYNVTSAYNGEEALQKLEEIKPDIVISDVMMPQMSGDQLVAEIRKSESYHNLPILLLSAKADDEMRIRLLREGAQDFVGKPFDRAELLVRVANLVKSKKAKDLLLQELDVKSGDIEELAREISSKKNQLESSLSLVKISRDEAQRASRVKTQFLGLISHELKTPLTNVHLNLQLMDRQKDQIRPETVVKYIDRALGASHDLSGMIESLLEHSRIEAGSISVNKEEIDLKELCESVSDNLSLQAKNKGLELKTECHTVPALVSDTRIIKIIINNLLSNAVKFTSEGYVKLKVDHNQEGHVIEVEDTGHGISEENLSRIFEPFYQVEPVQRKHTPGVGLGLALITEMVRVVNGEIRVDSEMGKGSKFTVIIKS